MICVVIVFCEQEFDFCLVFILVLLKIGFDWSNFLCYGDVNWDFGLVVFCENVCCCYVIVNFDFVEYVGVCEVVCEFFYVCLNIDLFGYCKRFLLGSVWQVFNCV